VLNAAGCAVIFREVGGLIASRRAKGLGVGVGGVVLAALHVWLDQLSRDRVSLHDRTATKAAHHWCDAPQASIQITVGASALKNATISLRRIFLRKSTSSVAFAP
jgi:hypothetical protein